MGSNTMVSMEESLTGFVCKGDWADIVEHGERITSALFESEADSEYPDEFERWNEWRPKANEHLDEDVSQKTAEEVRTEKGQGDKSGNPPDEDLGVAKNHLSDSLQDVEQGDTSSAITRVGDAIRYTNRAVDSFLRRQIRVLETFIYKHVMTAFSPYYFDTELVQANITKTSRSEERYRFEVNIGSDDLRDTIRDYLLEYDDISRWRMSVDKEVDTIVHSEGYIVDEEAPDSSMEEVGVSDDGSDVEKD